jgi:hypothetical protein
MIAAWDILLEKARKAAGEFYEDQQERREGP